MQGWALMFKLKKAFPKYATLNHNTIPISPPSSELKISKNYNSGNKQQQAKPCTRKTIRKVHWHFRLIGRLDWCWLAASASCSLANLRLKLSLYQNFSNGVYFLPLLFGLTGILVGIGSSSSSLDSFGLFLDSLLVE